MKHFRDEIEILCQHFKKNNFEHDFHEINSEITQKLLQIIEHTFVNYNFLNDAAKIEIFFILKNIENFATC